MKVKAKNLGYRKMYKLGAFIQRTTTEQKFIDFINDSREEIEIGYDLHYDSVYIIGQGFKFYEDDFE